MSEIIDLVDANGALVHRGVMRDDAKNYDGLHMQIVIVVVTNSLGHILVHERAVTKKVNPGDIDHVCGGIISGETPEDAAIREALEETGVKLKDLSIVRQGINSYGRYCHLIRATSNDPPTTEPDPREVAWVAYHPLEVLHARRATGDFTFVDGFFEDLEHALAAESLQSA